MPNWQLNGEVCVCGGAAGGGLARQTPQHGLPLSLSTSGEDFAPLWRIQKDSLWTEATGAKNT